MTLRQVIAGAALLAGLGAVTALAIRDDVPSTAARAPQARPTLALLTSLPLVFGEGFGLEDSGSAALSALEQRYNVVPIPLADAASLKGQRLLLMAHPRAQPAEVLVELDRWVRDGGHVLLLADPLLSWESKRPLGDPIRPPPAFADTGLLAHWGLQLVAADGPNPILLGGGHNPVVYFSAGSFVSTNPNCELYRADIIAECAIGKGRVIVVADADFINASVMEKYGGFAENQTGELTELLQSLGTR